MAVFAKVVEQGSFTAAARALGLGKSAVSQHVATLEDNLGVRLLNRSTRSLHLTDEGRRFSGACRQMLDTALQAVSQMSTTKDDAAGVVRLAASYNLGTTFLPSCLCAFRSSYPAVALDVVLDDGVVNLIKDGFDLALRVGSRGESSMITRKLGSFRMVLCAAADYLAVHGVPGGPEELLEHPWVSSSRLVSPEVLELRHADGREVHLKLVPAIRTNSGLAAHELVRNGAGIGALCDFTIQRELEGGSLVELLPGWRGRAGVVSAIYPHKQHLSPRTKHLVELLILEFRRQFTQAGEIAPA